MAARIARVMTLELLQRPKGIGWAVSLPLAHRQQIEYVTIFRHMLDERRRCRDRIVEAALFQERANPSDAGFDG